MGTEACLREQGNLRNVFREHGSLLCRRSLGSSRILPLKERVRRRLGTWEHKDNVVGKNATWSPPPPGKSS